MSKGIESANQQKKEVTLTSCSDLFGVSGVIRTLKLECRTIDFEKTLRRVK
jgi:hypothetical protein